MQFSKHPSSEGKMQTEGRLDRCKTVWKLGGPGRQLPQGDFAVISRAVSLALGKDRS